MHAVNNYPQSYLWLHWLTLIGDSSLSPARPACVIVAKDAPLIVVVVQLGATNVGLTTYRQEDLGSQKHCKRGCREINP